MRGDDTDVDMGRQLKRATHDLAAFEAVYRRYVGQVTGYAVTRCATAADVADVVAQTFVRLMQVADRYDPQRGHPVAFVMTVAGNVLRDHYRSDRRRRTLVHRLAGRDLLEQDETERIDAALDAARSAPDVRRAVDDLATGESEVLELVAGGASPAEAAAMLGIAPGTARGRLFRARRRVRSQLASAASAAGAAGAADPDLSARRGSGSSIEPEET